MDIDLKLPDLINYFQFKVNLLLVSLTAQGKVLEPPPLKVNEGVGLGPMLLY